MSNNIEAMKRIEEAEKNTLAKLAEKNKRWFEIQETIYLGKIDGKDLYRLAEKDNKDNYTDILYKYFDENAVVQGIKNVRPDGEKEWIYLGEEWEELRDEIDKNEAQLEEEIADILAELGISKEEVENVKEMDLDQQVKEKEDEEQEEEIEEDEEQEEKSKDKKEEENKSKQTSKYTNTLNEIDTNKYIDQRGTTLGKALGLNQYGYTKLLIVHSDNVRDIKDADGKHQGTPTKRLAILGVREQDGKQVVEKIPDDVLDYDRRSNNESVRFDDNDVVEKNSGTYERFVNPKTNKGISIEMSEMETKVYYQGGIDRDDNTAVMERIEDYRTGWGETETKELFNSNHGQYHQDKINAEMDMHDKDEGEEIHRDNGDGNLDTVSEHIHEIETPSDEIPFDGEIMTVEKAAEKMNIPLHMFIQEYNKRAKELQGEQEIDLEEDLYDEIEERAEERMENEPKQEEGGFALGDNRNPRGE